MDKAGRFRTAKEQIRFVDAVKVGSKYRTGIGHESSYGMNPRTSFQNRLVFELFYS